MFPTSKTPSPAGWPGSEDGDIWLHASPSRWGYLLEEWL